MKMGHRNPEWRVAMNGKVRSRALASLLAGIILAGLFALLPVPARAETSYQKLKKHLRTAEHNTGFLLGKLFENTEIGVDIDLDDLNVEHGRSEQTHPKVDPPKHSSVPAPAHKDPAKLSHPDKK
jgi:hypothetical protein